jgi:hypothetical protein
MSASGRLVDTCPATYSFQLHDKSWFRVCLMPSRSAGRRSVRYAMPACLVLA